MSLYVESVHAPRCASMYVSCRPHQGPSPLVSVSPTPQPCLHLRACDWRPRCSGLSEVNRSCWWHGRSPDLPPPQSQSLKWVSPHPSSAPRGSRALVLSALRALLQPPSCPGRPLLGRPHTTELCLCCPWPRAGPQSWDSRGPAAVHRGQHCPQGALARLLLSLMPVACVTGMSVLTHPRARSPGSPPHLLTRTCWGAWPAGVGSPVLTQGLPETRVIF